MSDGFDLPALCNLRLQSHQQMQPGFPGDALFRRFSLGGSCDVAFSSMDDPNQRRSWNDTNRVS